MDKLDEIFTMQDKLNQDIIQMRHLPALSNEEWLVKHMLAMFAEMAELLQETNYKWWKNPKEVNQENLKEEMVDILHFYVSMCLAAGMDAEELHRLYMDKNKENLLRQQGKSNKQGYDVKETSL